MFNVKLNGNASFTLFVTLGRIDERLAPSPVSRFWCFPHIEIYVFVVFPFLCKKRSEQLHSNVYAKVSGKHCILVICLLLVVYRIAGIFRGYKFSQKCL